MKLLIILLLSFDICCKLFVFCIKALVGNCIGGILLLAKKLNKDQLELLAKVIGVILIARSILVNPYVANLKGWDIYNNLPLHLCGLSAIISGIIMFYRKQWMYECLYYWGIPGAFPGIQGNCGNGLRRNMIFPRNFLNSGKWHSAFFSLTERNPESQECSLYFRGLFLGNRG